MYGGYFIKRRSIWYWIGMALSLAVVSTILFQLVYYGGPFLWYKINPRIPSFFNRNPQVIVEVLRPANEHINAFVEGTPIYCITPELQLVGYLAKLPQRTAQGVRFYLSILERQRLNVLREDTHFEFLHAAPSFMAILGRFFTKQRWSRVQEQLTQLAQRHRQRLERIFQHLSHHLGTLLGDQGLARRIMHDPLITKMLMSTLRQEVINQIDWRKALQSLEANEHTHKIVQVFESQVRWKPIINQGIGAGFDRGLDEMARWMFDPQLMQQYRSWNALRSVSVFLRAVTSPRQSWRVFWHGARKGAFQGGWRAGKRELQRVFERHQDAILQHGSASLKQAACEIKLMNKLGQGLVALGKHAGLRQHLKTRYGPRVLHAFTQTLNWAAHATQIQDELKVIGHDLGRLAAQWFSMLLLNEKKSGPNPLLLVFLREQITCKAEPQILCTPGHGAVVEEGYVYSIR